jgi:hypothetical protein
MAEGVQRHYSERAFREQLAVRARLADEMEVCSEKLKRWILVREAEESGVPPLMLSSCHLTEADLKSCDEMFELEAFSSAAVGLMRQASSCPRPPSREELLELTSIPLAASEGVLDARQPSWVGSVACHRDVFAETVFQFVDAGRISTYAFLFAMQRPYLVCFAPLEELEHFVSVHQIVTSDSWDEIQEAALARLFRCDFECVLFGDELPGVPIEQIQVFENVRYTVDSKMVCAVGPVPLQSILDGLPQPAASVGEPREATPQPSTTDALLRQFPWLQGHFKQEEKRRRDGGGGGPGPRDEPGQDRELASAELTDEQLEECFLELEDRRARMEDESVDLANFRVRVLGGPWCLAHLGVPYDAFQGWCTDPSAEATWAKRYKMGKTSRFGVGVFGDARSVVLANEWASRCQYYWNIFTEQDDDNYTFTENDYAGYKPRLAFLAALPSFDPGSEAHRRALILAQLKPSL